MAGKFASETTVTVEQSRMDIEKLLRRYGADSMAHGWDQTKAVIEFTASDRRVRFVLPLPRRDDTAFTHYRRSGSPVLHERTADSAAKQWEQACRQRWRALHLVVKAKLEAVEVGISTFEEEFLANIVMPGSNDTVGNLIRPALAHAYETGTMRALLPGSDT